MDALARLTPATIDVLRVLATATEAQWGLRIIRDAGRPPGSVYPILDRLERAGWATSEWEQDSDRTGPRRRYYALTDDGAAAAAAAIAAFEAKRRSAAPARGVPA